MANTGGRRTRNADTGARAAGHAGGTREDRDGAARERGTATGATPRGKRDDQEHFGVRGGHVGLCETCYGMWDYVKLERERHAHIRCDTRLTAGAG